MNSLASVEHATPFSAAGLAWQWSPTLLVPLAIAGGVLAFAFWSTVRGSARDRAVGFTARLVILACLLVMLSGWRKPTAPTAGDGDAERGPTRRAAVHAGPPRMVWLGDTAAIDVSVSLPPSSASSGDPAATAELFGEGRETPLQNAVLGPAEPAAQRRLRGRILWRPTRAETFAGSVRITVAGERLPAVPVTMRVVEEPLRVFMVDRGPRFDHLMVGRILGRDRRFRVTDQLEQPAGEPRPSEAIRELPPNREAWNRFDVVILGSIDPLSWPETVAQGLVDAATQDGVGIVWMLDGRSDLAAIGLSPLAALLPVRGTGTTASVTLPHAIGLTRAGRDAWWLAVADEADRSIDAWRSLPDVYSVAAVGATRPTAVVVAAAHPRQGDAAAPSPFMLADQAGAARIACILGETWRWRQGGRGDLVDRLWRQTVIAAAEPHAVGRFPDAAGEPQRETPETDPSLTAAICSTPAPPTDTPLWNHPAILAMLLAACGCEWWMRARLGEP